MNNGDVVYISGVHDSRIPEVSLATNANLSISNRTIGLVTQDLADGEEGFVTSRGLVHDIDTSHLTTFGPVYLGTDGNMTMTKPPFPANKVILGGVIDVDSTEGVFQVGLYRPSQNITSKSYSFTSNGVGAGSYYSAGYYKSESSHATLNQVTNIFYGSEFGSYAAHAFVVVEKAGSTDAGVVGLKVSGIRIEDDGTRTPGFSELIITDITKTSSDDYYESVKFVGQVSYDLVIVSGSPTTYDLNFNYGFAKYEDFGNNNFTLVGVESVGLAGATDDKFDIIVYHHSNNGWTYSAASFVPGGNVITSLKSTHEINNETISGEPFAFKRTGLSTIVDGADSEGIVIKIVTGQNGTVQSMDTHLGSVFN